MKKIKSKKSENKGGGRKRERGKRGKERKITVN